MPVQLEYVRLNDALQAIHGCVVDLETGWGVSGHDVRSWPQDPDAQKYARRQYQSGTMVEATQAEYDAVHAIDLANEGETPTVRFVNANEPIPENKLRLKLDAARRQYAATMAEARAAGVEVEPEEDLHYGDVADVRAELGTPGTPQPAAPQVPHEPDELDVDYTTWSNSKLQKELKARDLPHTGSKQEMADRLAEDDGADDGAAEETAE